MNTATLPPSLKRWAEAQVVAGRAGSVEAIAARLTAARREADRDGWITSDDALADLRTWIAEDEAEADRR